MADGLVWRDTCDATIQRIKAQDEGKSALGIAALMWLSHAERPLGTDELCHALAVELGSKDFNADNAPSISTLVGCCLGLITVDNEASTVGLIHPTLKEHLSTRYDIFSRPHSTIAEICLTYLNSQQFKAIPADHSPDMSNTPFLEYCSLYWGIHAKRDLSGDATSLALQLFQKYDGHISSKLLLEKVNYQNRRSCASDFDSDIARHSSSPFSALHCASYFGIQEIVATLINRGCYMDGRDSRGSTPLLWAARNGYEEVVGMLLRQLARADQSDFSGMTPLLYAIWGGHERVVEILLSAEYTTSYMPDDLGKTPLSYAAQGGLEHIVKILFDRGLAHPEYHDNSGKTPLSFAARSGLTEW